MRTLRSYSTVNKFSPIERKLPTIFLFVTELVALSTGVVSETSFSQAIEASTTYSWNVVVKNVQGIGQVCTFKTDWRLIK